MWSWYLSRMDGIEEIEDQIILCHSGTRPATQLKASLRARYGSWLDFFRLQWQQRSLYSNFQVIPVLFEIFHNVTFLIWYMFYILYHISYLNLRRTMKHCFIFRRNIVYATCDADPHVPSYHIRYPCRLFSTPFSKKCTILKRLCY